MNARRYHVTLRRTVTEEQSVIFIADDFAGQEMQHAVAAAYCRPEAWVPVGLGKQIEVVDLTSENITWEQI